MATERRDDGRTADRTRDAKTAHTTDGGDEAHLERSKAVWNRWSDWYALSERDLEPIREAAMDRLELESGDRVLDVGCGPGVNLERLRDDVGPNGEVVAVDYSPEMVAKARQRVADHGWENVAVRRADATQMAFDDPFDAALATLSFSLMPDVRRASESVSDALASDGRFVVFDVRCVQRGPARLANPLLRRFLRWYANWHPDENVLDSLEAVFERCEVVERYAAGAGYTAVCEKRAEA
ncbi:class I SAM-dependent methyltransferase [Natronolimnohabitans innermongolicus]|uniref:Methyltransferase type 11 n=1 Tax=Natronolimnohabitans innermongolicus JCM 12255 TaxID=1227499 RepID=L9WP04_9EURY|nr:class I SAM-dependent methyltransferase [Natronolimnohabitans innermongolicus]ELY50058.1 methyltransferase type 11 [Natronolimnohabitans innermongolicus JCM 12255]